MTLHNLLVWDKSTYGIPQKQDPWRSQLLCMTLYM